MSLTKGVTIGLLGGGLLLTGCSDRPAKAVRGDSTLVDVLVELHLLAARQAVVGDVTPAFRNAVLAHYGLDSATVVRQLEAYARDRVAFGQLYQQIQERLMLEHYGSEAVPR